MAAEGYKGEFGKWVKRAALDAAIQNPLRYVASIGVFAYKGMWFMPRAGALINLLVVLCFFGVFFAALFTRNQTTARGVWTTGRVVFFYFDLHPRYDALHDADDALRHPFRPLASRRACARGLSPVPAFPEFG